MTPFERLQIDQQELRAACSALCALVDQPAPPPRSVLAAARWRMARILLRHLPLKDRAVYARLRCHGDPGVAAIADRFAAEVDQIYDAYEKHTERWSPEAVEAEWPQYRFGVHQQAKMLEERLAREEADLLPHLATAPEVPVARSPDDRNWAAAGWRFRELLGVADREPSAAAG